MSRIVNTSVSKPRRDVHGRAGVTVSLHLESGGWDGHYAFHTHGMLPDSVKREQDRIVALHDRRAAKLTDYSSLIGLVLPNGFKITDATVSSAGDQFDVFCRATDGDAAIQIVRRINDPQHAPTASELFLLMRAKAVAGISDDNRAAAHVADVRKALGLP